MTFKEQTAILTRVLESAQPIGGCVDMTAVGLCLAEELSNRFPGSLTGVHFSQTVPWLNALDVRVTDAMSFNLLGLFESERIKIPAEAQLRASLQLPERTGKAGGILDTPALCCGTRR